MSSLVMILSIFQMKDLLNTLGSESGDTNSGRTSLFIFPIIWFVILNSSLEELCWQSCCTGVSFPYLELRILQDPDDECRSDDEL